MNPQAVAAHKITGRIQITENRIFLKLKHINSFVSIKKNIPFIDKEKN